MTAEQPWTPMSGDELPIAFTVEQIAISGRILQETDRGNNDYLALLRSVAQLFETAAFTARGATTHPDPEQAWHTLHQKARPLLEHDQWTAHPADQNLVVLDVDRASLLARLIYQAADGQPGYPPLLGPAAHYLQIAAATAENAGDVQPTPEQAWQQLTGLVPFLRH